MVRYEHKSCDIAWSDTASLEMIEDDVTGSVHLHTLINTCIYMHTYIHIYIYTYMHT